MTEGPRTFITKLQTTRGGKTRERRHAGLKRIETTAFVTEKKTKKGKAGLGSNILRGSVEPSRPVIEEEKLDYSSTQAKTDSGHFISGKN